VTNPNEARKELAKVYVALVSAEAMLKLAQGISVDDSAAQKLPDVMTTLGSIQKAEVFIGMAKEKLDDVVRSLGLPANWWTSYPDEEECVKI
jgi:hypothetical protein